MRARVSWAMVPVFSLEGKDLAATPSGAASRRRRGSSARPDDGARDAWGAPRIHAELTKRGFLVSEMTVSRYLPRRPTEPDQAKRWVAFLRNHKDEIAAMDLFTVPMASLRLLYGVFVIEHGRRHIVPFNATFHPTAAWVIQQLREAFAYDTAPRYLIFDRDSIFSSAVVEFIKAMGTKPVRISYRVLGRTEPPSAGSAAAVGGSSSTPLSSASVVSLASSGLTSATPTTTVTTCVSARIRRTEGLSHRGRRRRPKSLHCHEWVGFTMATSGATLRKAVFVAAHRLVGATIAFSTARNRRSCDPGHCLRPSHAQASCWPSRAGRR